MEILKGRVDCLPEETGYDSSRITALNEHFQRLIEKEMIWGTQYTISHKGKIIASASMGKGSPVDDVPMKPDTVFRIASITKTFTTVAIMKLVEDGYIRLDTAVGDLLPAFSKPPFSGITLWHLLTHTSGLYPDGDCYPDEDIPEGWDLIDAMSKIVEKDEEFDWVKATLTTGLRRPIGAEWMYNTMGFVILGKIISDITGMSAEAYIEKTIVQPLGMKDTSFDVTKEMAERFFPRNQRHKERLQSIIDGTYVKEDAGSIWEKIPSTGGGMNSTTGELIKFANMMLGMGRLGDVRILGRKAVEKITTYQLKNVPDYCWGSNEPNRAFGVGFDMRKGPGFTYSEGSYFHEGYGACAMYIDPVEQLAATWFVPWNKVGWAADALFNVQNVIWSGII